MHSAATTTGSTASWVAQHVRQLHELLRETRQVPPLTPQGEWQPFQGYGKVRYVIRKSVV